MDTAIGITNVIFRIKRNDSTSNSRVKLDIYGTVHLALIDYQTMTFIRINLDCRYSGKDVIYRLVSICGWIIAALILFTNN